MILIYTGVERSSVGQLILEKDARVIMKNVSADNSSDRQN